MLCCIVLYCVVLCCVALRCVALCCVALRYAALCGMSCRHFCVLSCRDPPPPKDPPPKGPRKARGGAKGKGPAGDGDDAAAPDAVDLIAYPHAGAPLATCFASYAFLDSLVPQLEELLAPSAPEGEGGPAHACVDLPSLLPAPFGPEDCVGVWQYCARRGPPVLAEGCALYGTFAVNRDALFPAVLRGVDAAARAEVQRRAPELRALAKGQGAGDGEDSDGDGRRRRGKDRKRGGGDGAGAGPRGDDGLGLDEEKLRALVAAALPAAVEKREEVAGEVWPELEPRIAALYRAARDEVLMDDDQRRRRTRARLQSEINGLWQDLQLHHRALGSFAAQRDAAGARALQRHLLGTLGAALVRCVVRDNALDLEEEFAADAGLDHMLGAFPKGPREALAGLAGAASGCSVPHFFAEMEKIAGICSVHLRPLDKRRERQHLQQRARELVDRVIACALRDPAELLLQVCLLLYFKQHHALLHAPRALIGSLIRSLGSLQEEKAPGPQIYELLLEAQSMGLERAGAAEGDAEGAERDRVLGAIKKATLGLCGTDDEA